MKITKKDEKYILSLLPFQIAVCGDFYQDHTPFMYSVSSSNMDFTEAVFKKLDETTLVQAVKYVSLVTGKQAIHIACESGNEYAAERILKLMPKDEIRYDEDYNYPLYYALRIGSIKIAELLFEKGMRVSLHNLRKNQVSDDDDMEELLSTLVVAAGTGDIELFKLCKKYIPPEKVSPDLSLRRIKGFRHSPVSSAANAGNLRMVSYLIHDLKVTNTLEFFSYDIAQSLIKGSSLKNDKDIIFLVRDSIAPSYKRYLQYRNKICSDFKKGDTSFLRIVRSWLPKRVYEHVISDFFSSSSLNPGVFDFLLWYYENGYMLDDYIINPHYRNGFVRSSIFHNIITSLAQDMSLLPVLEQLLKKQYLFPYQVRLPKKVTADKNVLSAITAIFESCGKTGNTLYLEMTGFYEEEK